MKVGKKKSKIIQTFFFSLFYINKVVFFLFVQTSLTNLIATTVVQ